VATLEKGKRGSTGWLDVRDLPTDRTLFIVPVRERGTVGAADLLCQLEVSPDGKTPIPLPTVYHSNKAHYVKTDFDYPYVRLTRLATGKEEATDAECSWTLFAVAADEGERAARRAERSSGGPRLGPMHVEFEDRYELPVGSLLDVRAVVENGGATRVLAGVGKHSPLDGLEFRLNPVQAIGAGPLDLVVENGALKVIGGGRARVWIWIYG